MAMRYVAGGDVRSLLHREGPLASVRAAAIISPVASALDAAHEAGLVHRDVKPANMLIDVRPGRPDHVYLSDFGLSKTALSSAGLTQTGQFLGTLDYAAPEQIEGGSVDGRTDEYALACAAFELLTGAPPFPREQLTAVMWAHMSAPPPPLTQRRPDLPPAADLVLARALSKAAADRYPTCQEFADALRDALALQPYGTGRMPVALPDHPRTEVARPAATPSRTRTRAGRMPVPVGDLTAGRPARKASAAPGPGEDEFPYRSSSPVTTMDFSPDGLMLAAGDASGSTCIWDMQTWDIAAILTPPGPGHESVEAVAFSPDGTMLAVTGTGTSLWDTGTASRAAILAVPGNAGIQAVAFSPDGAMLAVGGDDGSTRLWDPADRRMTATLTAPGSGGCPQWRSAPTARCSPPATSAAAPTCGIPSRQRRPQYWATLRTLACSRWRSARRCRSWRPATATAARTCGIREANARSPPSENAVPKGYMRSHSARTAPRLPSAMPTAASTLWDRPEWTRHRGPYRRRPMTLRAASPRAD
jgi:hypothetical protein